MSMERGHARILDDQSRLEYYFGNDAENWLNRTFAITPKKGTPIPIHSKKVMNKEGGGGLTGESFVAVVTAVQKIAHSERLRNR